MSSRLSAAAAMVAGAMLIVAVPLTELVSGEFFLLAPLGLLLLFMSIPGVRSTIPGAGGRPAAWAVRAVVAGAVVAGALLVLEQPLTSAGAPDALGWVAAIAAAVCGLGFLGLAVIALRAGGEPRWAWRVLLIAPIIGTPAEAFAHVQVLDLIGVTCVAAIGAALIGIGRKLHRSGASADAGVVVAG